MLFAQPVQAYHPDQPVYREHYQDMYFNRMATYYEKQSSGRYSVEGDVTEWVKVPYNQALYGRDYCSEVFDLKPMAVASM